MARIVILIGGHLATAPRPLKEADVLCELGHDVLVLGSWYDDRLAEWDLALLRNRTWRYRPVVDLRKRSPWRPLYRLQRRAAIELWARGHRFTPNVLGYNARSLLAHTNAIKPDLTIAHSEGALWAIEQLHSQGFAVGVDFEDWFSEDLLPESRRGRPVPVLRRLEHAALRTSVYRTTTSRALATALEREYDCAPPAPVYNTFPDSSPVAMLESRSRLSLVWYSQTVGPGRGLEELFLALQRVDAPVDLHCYGAVSARFASELGRMIAELSRHTVHLHGSISPEELPARLAECDIGLALEPRTPPNKDLTCSNKLLQYLQAGLAVIATATKGQLEVVSESAPPNTLIEPHAPEELANAIIRFHTDRERLIRAKQASRRSYETNFSYQSVRETIAAEVTRALGLQEQR